MIRQMVGILRREEADEEERATYCRAEIGKRRTEKQGLKKEIRKLDAWRADAKESLAQLEEELDGLREEVRDTDAAVVAAQERRRQQNAEFEAMRAENLVAVELLRRARDRLAQFYGPKPAATATGASAAGSSLIATASSGPGASIERLIAHIAADVEREIREAELADRKAQEDFEAGIAAATGSREEKTTAIVEAQNSLARLEAEIQRNRDRAEGKEEGLAPLLDALGDLHGECDSLLASLELRKASRAKEIEGLERATEVLAGAG